VAGIAKRRSEANDGRFVHARVLFGGYIAPSTTDLIWKMANTAGLYCQKVDIFTAEEAEWFISVSHLSFI